MKTRNVIVLLSLVILLLSASTHAGCHFSGSATYPMTATKNYTIPLSKNALSVPAGIAIGDVIFRQNIQLTSVNADKPEILCDTKGQFYTGGRYVQPMPHQVSTYNSNVYDTGIAGIGIRFGRGNTSTLFPYSSETTGCANLNNCHFIDSWWNASSWFELVKTNENVGQGTLTGTDFPTVEYTFGQKNDAVILYRMSLSGSLTLNIPTCNISLASQTMIIRMGSHKVSEFSGQWSGTAWKDASIRLDNCGWFYGNSSSSVATFNGSSNTSVINLTPNRAKLSLAAATTAGYIDKSRGIIKLYDYLPAVGIGVQLSRNQNESEIIDLNSTYDFSLPTDGRRIITVPLWARYVQTTAAPPLPGKANSGLEYIISYE